MSTNNSDDSYDTLPDEEDVYDDPYEVVMYDLDTAAADNVDALLNMLADPNRSWYAKRRLNVLAASGPLTNLTAAIIIDSLGRRWDPLLHPRDRFGQFIETGGFFRWFMKGVWTKGQVVRIDSDGTIHARSKGNDNIPDGTPIKFSNKQASKLVSTASDKASLSNDLPDFDAEIPGFPEASPTQRRLYNALQFGDMPGRDMFGYRVGDLSEAEFGDEISGLVDRNLIQVDGGDLPRVRRTDQDQLGILDLGDDDIDDVPDDETPDLDDSPALTKAQRDLYDQLVEMDRGEGDGIGPDELTDVSDEDLNALVEVGALDKSGDRFHLVNPEDGGDEIGDVPAGEIEAESDDIDAPDVVEEIDKAAKARFPKNIEQQEAFADRASELAGLMEADEGAEYGRDARRARSAADDWWEKYNTPETEAEAEAPEVAENALEYNRPELMRKGKFLLGHYFEDEYLDSEEGEAYALDIGNLIYAEDLRESGDSERADTYRNEARAKLAEEGLDQKEIDSWDEVIEAYRNGEGLSDPEAEEADEPEVDGDVPEADVPEEENPWAEYESRLVEEGLADTFSERVMQENRTAADLGLDPFNDEEAPWGWNSFADEVGMEEAERLFDENGGNLEQAMAVADIETPEADVDVPEADVPEADVPEADVPEDVPEVDAPDTEGVDADPNPLRNAENWDEIKDRYGELRSLKTSLEHTTPDGDVHALQLNFLVGTDDDGDWAVTDADISIDNAGNGEESLGRQEISLAANVLNPVTAGSEEELREKLAGWLDQKFAQLDETGQLHGELSRAAEDPHGNPLPGLTKFETLDSDGNIARPQYRNDARNIPEADVSEADVPEAEDVDVPEPDVDVPEADAPEDASWNDYERRLQEEGLADNLDDRIEQEKRIASELGLNHYDSEASDSWTSFTETSGNKTYARRLFDENGGDLERALAQEDDEQSWNDGLDEQQAVDDAVETDVDVPEHSWDDFAAALAEDGPITDNFDKRLNQERKIAGDLGLNAFDSEAPDTWDNLRVEVGEYEATALFSAYDGDIERAREAIDNPDVDAPEADAPEADVPEVPEADVSDDDSDIDSLMEIRRQWYDWEERVAARRDDDETLDSEIESEQLVADDMGLDLDEAQGVLTWTALRNGAGAAVTGELYEKHNGNVDDAMRDLLQNPEVYNDRVQAHRRGDVPEADAPELESEELDEATARQLGDIDFNLLGQWADWYGRVADRRDEDHDLTSTLEDERLLAEEMGLDFDAPGGIDSWTKLTDDIGEEKAREYYDRFNGDVTRARLTQMSEQLDGLDSDNAENDLDRLDADQNASNEDVLSAYSDEELSLLEQLGNGQAVRRNQRDTEDSLFDKGLLEEDENGDTRLSQAGNEALALRRGEDTAADDVVETQAPETPDEADVADEDPGTADVPDTADDADIETALRPDAPELPDPTVAGDFPGFKWISGAGGLNAGGMYQVTEDSDVFDAGELIYVKNGRSFEHAQSELLANRLYELAGIPVPETIEGSTGDRIASRVVPGVRNFNPHGWNDQEVLDKIRTQFAIDAWIANWDGMNPGNTMVDTEGNPYRIDVGSAMEYRAQGGLKGDAFGDKLDDLDTLRNPNINFEAGNVFGSMSEDEVRDSVRSLAEIDPDDIRSTILSSNLPDKDALAEKMLARRRDALERYDVEDPFAPNTGTEDVVEEDDDTLRAARATPTVFVTPQQTTLVKTRTADATKKLQDFLGRTNPNIEPKYDASGNLLDAKGDPLDFSTYYRKARGGEGKNGLIIEVLDQEKYPGFVLMEYQNGDREVRHVLGVGSGTGGLVPSSQEDIDGWERQTSVVDDKADIALPEDWPMGDGTPSDSGTPVVFEVGGEEFRGVLLYFNHKHGKSGIAYIMPEGGGKAVQKQLGKIRRQTEDEIDSDAAPLVPYEKGKKVQQYLPAPRFAASGELLSREDVPINIGDWLGQRAGGDNLIGEVIDIPDQNLYPGWVTLRFPDGEVRSRHVEGFTDVGKVRGSGGLRHADAPDMSTWNRQRRVVGEEGTVLSYDFSDLETLDGTEIKVGEAVFGKDRRGQDIAGLLIRINPHVKRNGKTVPTGYVWQNGREVPVDIGKITNTVPTNQPRPARPTPRPRPVPTPGQRTPRAPGSAPTPRPAQRPRPTSQPGTSVRPTPTTANPAPTYGPGRGRDLSEEEIADLDIDRTYLYTSDRYTGVHAGLGALAEAQDFDGLPQVVGQAEYVRLVEEEGYVPILRRVGRGADQKTGLKYDQSYAYGRYYAGDGIHGNGNYFGYGRNTTQDVEFYGSDSIFALVKPEDLNSIDEEDLIREWKGEMRFLRAELARLEPGTPEYDRVKKKLRLYDEGYGSGDGYGEYAIAKGYDAIIAPGGNYRPYHPNNDPNLQAEIGYLVILNRSATIVSDTPFEMSDDIFKRGFPATLAPDVPSAEVVPTEAVAPTGDVV
jgi:hypothetical protein